MGVNGEPELPDGQDLVAGVEWHVPRDFVASPRSPDFRCRHISKGGASYYLVLSEKESVLRASRAVSAPGQRFWIDPRTGEQAEANDGLYLFLEPYGLRMLKASGGVG